MKNYVLVIFSALLLTIGAFREASAAGPAARQGDSTTHGGVIVGGTPTVLISNVPAATLGDLAICPQVSTDGGGPVPHVGGPIVTGVPTVLIGGMPAATLGDIVQETGTQSSISIGAPTVLIGTGG